MKNITETLLWLFNNPELSTLEIIFPGILPAETIAMMASQDPQERRFDCPIFVAESVHNRPRTCNNIKLKTMSEIRRHLTRPSAGYPPQVPFLRLCRTCNEDFTDRAEFEGSHGYRGELCNNARSQRRRGDAKLQWEALYRKLEVSILAQSQMNCKFADASQVHHSNLQSVQYIQVHPFCNQRHLKTSS